MIQICLIFFTCPYNIEFLKAGKSNLEYILGWLLKKMFFRLNVAGYWKWVVSKVQSLHYETCEPECMSLTIWKAQGM